MPALSPTMTQGNIGKWHKKVGDEITAGDVLVEIETDKAQMDFEFQEDGFIAKLLVDEGAKDVLINEPLAILVDSQEAVEKFADFTLADIQGDQASESSSASTETSKPSEPESKSTETASSNVSSSTSATTTGDRKFASPAARFLAESKGLDINLIQGTGPNGRVIKEDVLNFKPSAEPAAASSTPASATPKAQPAPQKPIATQSAYTDIPTSGIRKVIASRLSSSKQDIPHYYITVEINVDKVLKLRQHLNSNSEGKYKLSVNDFITKASALAMAEVPEVNSAWHGDFIRQYHNVDISIATATPTGLITPIVTKAEGKGLATISSEVKALAAKARDNALKPEEYQGGSFTISNLGMFGVSNFTAIVNPPQSCILAVGTTESKVVVDPTTPSGFKATEVLKVTLSCDHRVVDGAVGARWLQAFKKKLEDPLNMLL